MPKEAAILLATVIAIIPQTSAFKNFINAGRVIRGNRPLSKFCFSFATQQLLLQNSGVFLIFIRRQGCRGDGEIAGREELDFGTAKCRQDGAVDGIAGLKIFRAGHSETHAQHDATVGEIMDADLRSQSP